MRPTGVSAVVVWLVAALALCSPGPAAAQALAPLPALDSPVVDTTATLDPAARQALETRARDLQRRKGSQLQVLIVPSTQPEDIAQYAVRAFDAWRLGREGVDDGVLLVVAKDDRRVRIEVGYGLEGAIPDATAHRVIQEYLVPKFRQGDYAGGIGDASAVLAGLIEGEPLPAPMAPEPRRPGSGNWLLGLVAAFFVAQLARVMLARLPAVPRGVIGGGLSAGAAWWLSSAWLVGGFGGLVGFLVGIAGLGGGGGGGRGGRYARDRGWGGFGGPGLGGGWGGGSSGGFGGGWSGGGGMSGGGGASGSW
ncbi:TPM domain-containing protein [Lysobacter sp. SG-8]|uniref:TPM domain-containing protein n=1 Tax=Marilutibacter penaei TaxID=2759900 RepID=A0A7W3U3X2_9GAMM|nr:TPM domain-containing protein [Lysobacter penaei]MBB1088481.1 TPM domain-containing protein [Lysobacter penaei]